jgi:hypothetical protein
MTRRRMRSEVAPGTHREVITYGREQCSARFYPSLDRMRCRITRRSGVTEVAMGSVVLEG